MTERAGTNERARLEQAIAVLEAQRAALGDTVVDAALEPMREKLARLMRREMPRQQRKLASILFMDIAGHTNLVRDLDPEENMALIDSALARLDDPVFKFGGHIARYQGDGFKAVFGLPNASEEDAMNAVRAGLEILAEAQEISREVQASWGIEAFRVRVGIDTGTIFAGGLTEGEDTIKGNPVNTAARLESAAQPGTLLISHNTYQHIRGAFELLPHEPVAAKGYPRPVQVYQVVRAKEDSFRQRRRGIEGIETRLVGREDELSLLQETFTKAVESGECHFVTVEGDEGIGKSRLMYEFENRVDMGNLAVTVFHGRARQEAQRLPYSLMRELIAFRFNIQDDDSVQAVREKLEAGVSDILGNDETTAIQAHYIGHLLGYELQDSAQVHSASEDPRQMRDRALAYLTATLQSAARQNTLLVLIDDLQWADDSSLETLARIVPALRALPAVFVATARPAFFENHPGWLEGWAGHRRFGLFPLDETATQHLIAEILQGVENIPSTLVELIIQRAEGNPFYAEELIKKLMDDGVIFQKGDTWQVKDDPLSQLTVPPTLVGIIQARIDSLSPLERGILQQASVVGRVFWDGILQSLNQAYPNDSAEADIDEILDSLQLKEMVYRRAISTFSEASEHIFKHAALQEVAYESVLLRLRKRYHASVAEWLIEHSQDRAVEIAGLIAYHLEQTNQPERALQYLLMAGERAAATFANNEAVQYYTHALGILPEARQETRFEALMALNYIYDLQGDRSAQGRDLPTLEELAKSIPGEAADQAVRQAKVAQRQSKYYEAMGQFDLAAQAAEQTVRFASEGGDVVVEAAGLIRWIVALWRQGYYDRAQEQAEWALARTQQAGIQLYEAHALVQLGNLAWLRSESGKAAGYYEAALPIYRGINYHQGLAATLLNLAMVQIDQRDFDQAELTTRQALEEYQITGDKKGTAQVYSVRGNIANSRCELAEAVQENEKALALTVEMGDRNQEAIVISHLGKIFLSSGDTQRAGEAFSRSYEIAKGVGNRRSQCLALMGLALICALEGKQVQCSDLLSQALTLADEIGLKAVKAEVLATSGYALLAAGETRRAQQAYDEARTLVEAIEETQINLQIYTGLARLALAKKDLDTANLYVNQILPAIRQGEKEPSVMWFLNHLTCIQALTAAADPRATEIIAWAYEQVCQRHDQVRALGIHKEFIENIPWHREITRLWEEYH